MMNKAAERTLRHELPGARLAIDAMINVAHLSIRRREAGLPADPHWHLLMCNVTDVAVAATGGSFRLLPRPE